MSKEIQPLSNAGRKYKSPGERTVLFIKGILDWIREIFAASTTIIPRGQVFQHYGYNLLPGREIRYSHILLVEDNQQTAREFIETIKNYYEYGSVKILVAYTYNAAVTFFDDEEINLVIMDADLNDINGDGTVLTRKFLRDLPGIIILANSSSRISNMLLSGFGAMETLGKSTEKLNNWLLLNDPTGTTG